MANNRVIQYDNAVIDYTTITALIQAVNNQQVAIDDLVARTTTTQAMVDANGNIIKSMTGTQKIVPGQIKVDGLVHKAVTYTGFSQPPVVVGIVQCNGNNPRYTYFQKEPTKDSADFYFSSKCPTGAILHWVAVGQ